jgi:hypothetical protein
MARYFQRRGHTLLCATNLLGALGVAFTLLVNVARVYLLQMRSPPQLPLVDRKELGGPRQIDEGDRLLVGGLLGAVEGLQGDRVTNARTTAKAVPMTPYTSPSLGSCRQPGVFGLTRRSRGETLGAAIER